MQVMRKLMPVFVDCRLRDRAKKQSRLHALRGARIWEVLKTMLIM